MRENESVVSDYDALFEFNAPKYFDFQKLLKNKQDSQFEWSDSSFSGQWFDNLHPSHEPFHRIHKKKRKKKKMGELDYNTRGWGSISDNSTVSEHIHLKKKMFQFSPITHLHTSCLVDAVKRKNEQDEDVGDEDIDNILNNDINGDQTVETNENGIDGIETELNVKKIDDKYCSCTLDENQVKNNSVNDDDQSGGYTKRGENEGEGDSKKNSCKTSCNQLWSPQNFTEILPRELPKRQGRSKRVNKRLEFE